MTTFIPGGFEDALGIFIIFFRVGSAFAVLPALGERIVSIRLRLVLAFFLSASISPSVDDLGYIFFLTSELIVLMLFSEVLVGLIIGLLLRFTIIALQTAGSIVAQVSTLSHLAGNTGSDPLPAIGQIFFLSAVAFLMASGYLVNLVHFFVLSYNFFDVGKFVDPYVFFRLGVDKFGEVFRISFSLSAPFFVISFIYNVSLGVINKAMPQLMVSFIGAPVISLMTLVFLFLSTPEIISVWVFYFEDVGQFFGR